MMMSTSKRLTADEHIQSAIQALLRTGARPIQAAKPQNSQGRDALLAYLRDCRARRAQAVKP